MGSSDDGIGALIVLAIIIFVIIVVLYIIFYVAMIAGGIGALWGSLISTRNFIIALKHNLFRRNALTT